MRDLLAERTRVLLTIFAIAWGTLSISVMLAFGEGLRQSLTHNVKEIGQNLLILRPGMSTHVYRGQLQQPLNLLPQDLTHIASLPGIEAVTPEYRQFDIELSYKNNIYYGAVIGAQPDYGKLRNIQPIAKGHFINELDQQQRHWVVVLGAQVAKKLTLTNHELGKIIYVNRLPFTLIGILPPKKQMTGYQPPDDSLVWIPASTYQLIWGEEIVHLIIQIAANVNHKHLINQIIQTLAVARGLAPDDKGLVNVLDIAESQQKITQFLLGLEIFLGLAGLLTLIAAGVGIANVMFISVSNTTREIGIRKAVGAQNKQIMRYYIGQALAITSMGGVIGIGGSYVIVFVLNNMPLATMLFRYMERPQLSLSLRILIGIVVILGGVGLLAGLFPARRAARVDPVVALQKN